MVDAGRSTETSDRQIHGQGDRGSGSQAEFEREMIRCVLFDLDGTLIDSLELYVQAVKRTLKDTIFEEVPTERLTTLRLNSEPRLLGYFVSSGEVETAHRRFLANYSLLHEEYFDGVYPGVQELLASLRRNGFKTGIVTGKSRGAWEITRSHAGLGDFDTLVFDDDVSMPKPDCEGIVKAMTNLGASPGETVYIGDSVSDLEAATGAGVGFLAARWSKTEAEISSFEKAAAEIGPCTWVEHPNAVEAFL